MTAIDRVSIEPSRYCSKACSFCYNASAPIDAPSWSAENLVDFARSCAKGGVRFVSFGGGEPLEYPAIFSVLDALRGVVLRSLTTNGLPLEDAHTFDRLVLARPDKVHVSVHAPENPREVERAAKLVTELSAHGVPSGVNLLVRRSRLLAAQRARDVLAARGIANDRLVYLPMRGSDTPTPNEIAVVARGPFQSMTCLQKCGKSPRFASVDAEMRAAFCSYTQSRRRLDAPTFDALNAALDGLDLAPCDGPGLLRVETLARRTVVAAR